MGIFMAHVLPESVVVLWVVTAPDGRVARSLIVAPLTFGVTVPLTIPLSCEGTSTD
jgi:hypothetical protein